MKFQNLETISISILLDDQSHLCKEECGGSFPINDGNQDANDKSCKEVFCEIHNNCQLRKAKIYSALVSTSLIFCITECPQDFHGPVGPEKVCYHYLNSGNSIEKLTINKQCKQVDRGSKQVHFTQEFQNKEYFKPNSQMNLYNRAIYQSFLDHLQETLPEISDKEDARIYAGTRFDTLEKGNTCFTKVD